MMTLRLDWAWSGKAKAVASRSANAKKKGKFSVNLRAPFLFLCFLATTLPMIHLSKTLSLPKQQKRQLETELRQVRVVHRGAD